MRQTIFAILMMLTFAAEAATDKTFPPIKIARMVHSKTAVRRNYPYALTSLIKEINTHTALKLDPQPVIIETFSAKIFDYPFIYVNYADRKEWKFSADEAKNLKQYLEKGGFIYIDAGVNASFLREDADEGQHHSFANWDVTDKLKESFAQVFPEKNFKPLPRSHKIFSILHQGLPDPSKLPDTVRDFVINEKWPDGTYSLVGLDINKRMSVVVSPILAMGWGKNQLGNWVTNISFRVRESEEGLAERLSTAAYSGGRHEAIREDGRKDYIYTQEGKLPSWAEEADGNWRVFRYYQSTEINAFAHHFYTRLGTNIFIYAMTH